MDLKLIKNLLTMISDSDVNEVSIEEGEFKIKIKKQPDVVQMRGSAPVNYMQLHDNPSVGQNPVAAAPSAPAPSAAPADETKTAENAQSSKTVIIKSPIVGTWYEASAPDQDPFVQIGSKITKGKTLCIIEAMKIMNEIESEYDGKIVNILVNNAQPVEFDQPLFEIEPA